MKLDEFLNATNDTMLVVITPDLDCLFACDDKGKQVLISVNINDDRLSFIDVDDIYESRVEIKYKGWFAKKTAFLKKIQL